MYIILWMMLSLVLSGCQNREDIDQYHRHSSTKHVQEQHATNRYVPTEKDSAPTGPVPSFFKAVKPIFEPLSRYGNPDTYRVDGKNYTVLTSATGFRQRGTASWYGTKFHSRRTSSGEDYDMYALTAAHKTLPLPTYIRVKNLNNGRVAIVKVNDRGPFHSNRILDLSYGAAAKLGIFPKGTAPVEIEALTVKSPRGQQQARYYVQAGAFGSRHLADVLRQKLSHMTSSPVFIQKEAQHYLVRVGPFANKQMTDRLKQQLAHHGIRGSFSFLM